MIEKVRWGVLSTASIAVNKVIPSMKQGNLSHITAIASRDSEKASQAAQKLDIPKAYGSYEELLADEEIEAVYNPLPNHLHLPWTIKAAEAGKHVLCEKPITLTALEARQLIEVSKQTGVNIEEAFMVRAHPQWLLVRDLIKQGRIGELQAVNGFFSYFNTDAANIRNQIEMGGGALMDIGCYCINIARFVFDDEPRRVLGLIKRDNASRIDKLTSAMLDFPAGQAVFTCGTQLVPSQKMQFFGSRGRIEVIIPFNIPTDRPTPILIDDGTDLFGKGSSIIELPAANQYTIQGDLFSQAIRENGAPAVALEDSVKNMAVIDAVFRSAESQQWEKPESF